MKQILGHQTYSNHINSFGYNGTLNNMSIIPGIIKIITQQTNYLKDIENVGEKSLIDDISHINPFLIEFDYDDEALKEKKYYLKAYENFEIILKEQNNFVEHFFPLASTYLNYLYNINDEKYFSFLTIYNSEKFMNFYKIQESNEEIFFNAEFLVKGKQFASIQHNFTNNSLQKYILSLNFVDNFNIKLNNSDETLYLLKKGKLYQKLKMKDVVKNILFEFAELFKDSIQRTKD